MYLISQLGDAPTDIRSHAACPSDARNASRGSICEGICHPPNTCIRDTPQRVYNPTIRRVLSATTTRPRSDEDYGGNCWSGAPRSAVQHAYAFPSVYAFRRVQSSDKSFCSRASSELGISLKPRASLIMLRRLRSIRSSIPFDRTSSSELGTRRERTEKGYLSSSPGVSVAGWVSCRSNGFVRLRGRVVDLRKAVARRKIVTRLTATARWVESRRAHAPKPLRRRSSQVRPLILHDSMPWLVVRL